MEQVITYLPIEFLKRGTYQPRRQFDEVALQELAQSIQSIGLIQPIAVRAVGDSSYEIIAGERRWRACQLAGLAEVACIIYNYNDEQAAHAATIENLQRQDLNPIEEAQAYYRLMQEFDYTHEQIAQALGKSRAKISNSVRLLTLLPTIQTYLIEKQLSEGHGKILVGLPEHVQKKLADKCVQLRWSVRKLEQEIKKSQEIIAPEQKDANVLHLEKRMTESLAAEVKLDQENAGSGWVKIRYYDLETLSGIIEKMGVKED